jgi:GNAT superfamily N-acetyltransferase
VELVQVDTNNRTQVRQFLHLPFDLYRDVPQWVPPLAPDVRRMLDRRRHPFYRNSDADFFLAVDEGRAAGRIAVLDNTAYNTFNSERTAFFYLFECVDDAGIASALFDAAITWARTRGLNRLLGPRGFSVFDGLGLLMRGFEHRPAFGLPYNLPYYPALVEAAGFGGTEDIVSGYLTAEVAFPERIHRLSELVQQRRGLHIVRCRNRRDLRAIIPKLKDLYNGALGSGGGGVPLTPEDVKGIADQMLWFADPRLIKIVMKGDEPVGFLFAYPDVSAALQRSHGKLFPTGWFHLWRELKHTRWINVNGAGIVEQYRGLGGTAILFSEMHKSVVEGGYLYADLVQIGLENDKMQRELQGLGIDFYKTHRMYQRLL